MKELNKTKILRIPILGDLAVSLGRTIFGIVLGLIASGILIACSGVNPFTAYGSRCFRQCSGAQQCFSKSVTAFAGRNRSFSRNQSRCVEYWNGRIYVSRRNRRLHGRNF